MVVLEKILPKYIFDLFSKLNFEKLYEIRLRSGYPLIVNYGGENKYITNSGSISSSRDNAYIVAADIPQFILGRACEFSMYAYNNKLKDGFVSIEGGLRIGVAGEIVYEGNEIKTIKNINSINIRIPHQINGCSDKIFAYLFENGLPLSTLVISPPGAGKTTLLRDLARNFSRCKTIYNIVIADERCEIAAVNNGKAQLNIGSNSDVISCCKKDYALGCALRTLGPDILITDEIATYSDLNACVDAIWGGVTVIASAHAKDLEELIQRLDFGRFLTLSFKRVITLSSRLGKGTIEKVSDCFGKVFYEAS